jgi:hypothetical protein
MPDLRLLALARDARERAKEILARAVTFNDASAREGMREIAERNWRSGLNKRRPTIPKPKGRAAWRRGYYFHGRLAYYCSVDISIS